MRCRQVTRSHPISSSLAIRASFSGPPFRQASWMWSGTRHDPSFRFWHNLLSLCSLAHSESERFLSEMHASLLRGYKAYTYQSACTCMLCMVDPRKVASSCNQDTLPLALPAEVREADEPGEGLFLSGFNLLLSGQGSQTWIHS